MWNIIYYEKEDGTIPVKRFIEKLPLKHKAKAISEISHDIILLHGFIKKTKKTPQSEVKRAFSYLDDYVRRYQQ